MLNHAKTYIDKQISLIPVGKDKKPLIAWKEYQNKRATYTEVERWYKKYPDMQIAIVTGKISKVIVVDIDDPDMDREWLPKTAIVKTGSGGFHYYYHYTEGMQNKAGIKEKVDIRGDGGYVLAPPSCNEKGEYKWLEQRPLAPFPKELFQDRPTNEAPPNIKSNIQTEYQGYGQGQRNQAMAGWIGHLLAKIHPSEWDTLAWQAAKIANNKNTPPLSEYELKTTFESIKKKEQLSQTVRWYQKDESKKETCEPDVDEILPLHEVATFDKANYSEKISTGIEILDKVLGGGLNYGDLITVAAPTGMGKTTFSQTLTYNIAKQGYTTLWFSYEVLCSHLWDKFSAMGVDTSWLIYSPKKIVSGSISWVEDKIIEAKKKHDVVFVAIDHLGFLSPKMREQDVSKNYSAYLGQICRDLKRIALDQKVIILLPVHMRKTDKPNDMNDIGNSAGIGQESDLVIMLSRETAGEEEDQCYTDHTLVSVVKNRKTGKTFKAWFQLLYEIFIHDNKYVPRKIIKKRF